MSTETAPTPYARHLGIFDPHKYNLSASVVGCGAIGSFVSMGLAKMGIVRQDLFDFDKVELENLPVQMHKKESCGTNKAEATKDLLKEVCAEKVDVDVFGRWDESVSLETDIIVSAVDSLEVRKEIWEVVRLNPSHSLLVDARIGGQGIKIYAIDPMNTDDAKIYERSLECLKGSELPCTERGVIDVSLFASALLIRAVRRWTVKHEKETYRIFDLGSKINSML